MKAAARIAAVGLAACWCLLGAPRPADAWRTEGAPLWPGGTVRYFNEAPDQSWAVATAVRAWNRSGARVRFVPSSRASAGLVIRHLPRAGCDGSSAVLGRATVGFTPRSVVYVRPLDETSLRCNRFTSATAVAHELGHVLGLGHEDRWCALMNRAANLWGPTRCGRSSLREWRCQLVTTDDAAGAVHLYGGVARRQPGPEMCRFWSSISRPGVLRAVYVPSQVGVSLGFTRPPAPSLPPFIRTALRRQGASPQESFAFTSRRDACPTNADLSRSRRLRWPVEVGGRAQIVDRLQPSGSYCYAVWAYDAAGVPSDQPSLAWVRIP